MSFFFFYFTSAGRDYGESAARPVPRWRNQTYDQPLEDSLSRGIPPHKCTPSDTFMLPSVAAGATSALSPPISR